jgi:hypothetical protein
MPCVSKHGYCITPISWYVRQQARSSRKVAAFILVCRYKGVDLCCPVKELPTFMRPVKHFLILEDCSCQYLQCETGNTSTIYIHVYAHHSAKGTAQLLELVDLV